MKLRITFDEPYQPKQALPPMGEKWLWRHIERPDQQFVGWLNQNGNLEDGMTKVLAPEFFTPVQPYIDWGDPTTLDRMPRGEAVVARNLSGQYIHVRLNPETCRSVDIWLNEGWSANWDDQPELYPVYARPNAKLTVKVPNTVGDLEPGTYCNVRDCLLKRMDHLVVFVAVNPVLAREHHSTCGFGLDDLIDLRPDGSPIIHGKGLRIERIDESEANHG